VQTLCVRSVVELRQVERSMLRKERALQKQVCFFYCPAWNRLDLSGGTVHALCVMRSCFRWRGPCCAHAAEADALSMYCCFFPIAHPGIDWICLVARSMLRSERTLQKQARCPACTCAFLLSPTLELIELWM
jgi:hypothetical protein